jgi:hypothetical protein
MAEEHMSKDEQIGFHKGSLSTLAKERNELGRMINIVDQLMQMHLKALSDLGVKISSEGNEDKKHHQKEKKPIEDIL